MAKKKWADLSPQQRTMVVGASIVQIGLMAAAQADLRHRTRDELTAPKALWVTATFVNFVGPIAYFLFGRRKR